jgi:DNA-binding transcriptional LysR family regulator
LWINGRKIIWFEIKSLILFSYRQLNSRNSISLWPPDADGVEIIPLKEEIETPFCSPVVAALIRKSVDLLDQTLIRSEVKRVQWHQWFAANGLEAPALHGMRFDRSLLTISMAAEGLGVALDAALLAERELTTVRLARRFAGGSTDR